MIIIPYGASFIWMREMCISKLYREEDRVKNLEFLRQNEFATLVTYDGEKPTASHLLFEVTEEGESLFLNGHISKVNPSRSKRLLRGALDATRNDGFGVVMW